MTPRILRAVLRAVAGLMLIIVGSGSDLIYVAGVDWSAVGVGLFFWSFAVEP